MTFDYFIGKAADELRCRTAILETTVANNRMEIHCPSSRKIRSLTSLDVWNGCEGHGIFETKLYALLDWRLWLCFKKRFISFQVPAGFHLSLFVPWYSHCTDLEKLTTLQCLSGLAKPYISLNFKIRNNTKAASSKNELGCRCSSSGLNALWTCR